MSNHDTPEIANSSAREFSVPTITLSEPEDPMALLRRFWHIIIKRLWLVLLAFVVVVALTVAYTLNLPKKYEAQTSLIINMVRSQVLGSEVQPVVEMSSADFWNSSQYFRTQYQIIKSRQLAARVVERLGLADDLVFLGLDQEQDTQLVAQRLKQIDPVDVLLGAIEIEPAKDSRIVIIKVRHTSPKMAMQLANEVAVAYQQQNMDRSLESTNGAYNWLTNQYQDVKKRLEDSDFALYNFKLENNILSTSLEDRQNILSQRLQALNRQLTDVRAERIRLAADVQLVRQMKNRELTRAASSEVISNPLVQQLKASLNELKKREAELEERYLDQHPELNMVRNQLKTTERALQKEIGTILRSVENKLVAVQRTEQGLQAELERAKTEALDLNKKEVDYSHLLREQKNNSRVYELVLRRLKETDLSRLLTDNNIQILDQARLPEGAVWPIVPLNVALGCLLGVVLGLLLAVLFELLDNSVKTQEDIEGYVGLTFLGMIPSVKDKSFTRKGGETFVHRFPKSALAECCRSVRTNIMFMSPDNALKRILITSAGPQEGKTLTVANIATVMAQSDTRILILDTDMRRPRVHKVFNLPNKEGLSSLLLGEATYDEVIQPTDVPNIDIITCGPIPPNPSELMLTERFLEILQDLEDRYDRVLLDSPPVIAVADPMILSNLVDGVIFVVNAGVTSKEFARQAVQRLSGVNAPFVGGILNNVDLTKREYGHHYYQYYRRYGDYSSDEPEGAASDAA